MRLAFTGFACGSIGDDTMVPLFGQVVMTELGAVDPAVLEAQARRMLASGRDTKDVLEFLAATLTNRLMHGPSQRLREAAERGDADLIRAAQQLFGADKPREDSTPEIAPDAPTRAPAIVTVCRVR